MITFEELEQLSKVKENEFESKKNDSLNENYEREIEAKIDRAIMLTRMSNPDKTEITVSLGNEYTTNHVQHVLAKYEQEGYEAAYRTFSGVDSNGIDLKSSNIDVDICWDNLIGSFYAAMKSSLWSDEDKVNICVVTDNDIATTFWHYFGKKWSHNIDMAYNYICKEIYGPGYTKQFKGIDLQ